MSESTHVGCIRYSHELKLEITKRYLSEQTSVRKLSEEYGISFEAVRRTVIKYKPEALRLFFRNDISLTRMKKEKDTKSLEKEVLRLREELKLANIKAEGYEHMLHLASEEYGEDLLKKAVAKQSEILKGNIPK